MLEDIKQKCKEDDVKLLFVTKFGSHLYGTDTPESDTDYKGLFLPSKKQCFTCNCKTNITYSTGDSNGKNNKDDIDVQLWSLQHFFKKASTGETNALDLLFSFTFPECIIYKHPIMDRLFKHYNQYFNIKDCYSFVGYSKGQAKKYGLKGTMLGIIKNVYEYLIKFNNKYEVDYSIKLGDIIDEIDEKFGDDSYCLVKLLKSGDKELKTLFLCGKKHQETIPFNEFLKRVKKQYEEYGDRAKLAEQNKGIDWKALSHAVRAIHQMDELIETGKIEYPLKDVDFIKDIKLGKHTFKEVEIFITEGIERVDKKLNDPNLIIRNTKNQNLIESIITDAYDFWIYHNIGNYT